MHMESALVMDGFEQMRQACRTPFLRGRGGGEYAGGRAQRLCSSSTCVCAGDGGGITSAQCLQRDSRLALDSSSRRSAGVLRRRSMQILQAPCRVRVLSTVNLQAVQNRAGPNVKVFLLKLHSSRQ